MANVKNYNEQGGARTVIGGSLDVASGGDLDIESGGALKIAGTQITATAAELNYLDNSALNAADLAKLAAITATSTEVNILAGVTADADDLAKLDAITATSTEINILAGVTADADDLAKLDAITATSTEVNILAGVTTNASELNELDGGLFGATFAVGVEDGTTSTIAVDVQLTDAKGVALAHRAGVYMYVSDDVNGDSLATAVDTLAAGTDGMFQELLTGQAGMVMSESDGDIDISVTTSDARTVYLAVVLPDGSLATSTGLVFAT